LIDFGIARNFTSGKKKDTTPLGSPGFAPPEQYGRSQTDQRADIYSLGATLQTLFTGRDPLELRAGEPARNPSHPSRALSKLLTQMQSPVAKRRPASMNAIKRRLESARRRPFSSYLVGLAVTVIISSILAFFIVSNEWRFMGGAIGGLSMTVVNIIRFTRQRFKKKHGLQRFSWPFALLGSLTGVLPFLLLLLWHIFGWLF
jgi:serine/threonine protein kinase